MSEVTKGVLAVGLDERAVQLLYGADANAAIDAELAYMIRIDRAHLVMLHSVGLLNSEHVSGLLAGIEQIEQDDFQILRGVPAPRGLYFLYEDALRRNVGEDLGGRLHTARSRNDLKTTVLNLRMRDAGLTLANTLIRLLDVLLDGAEKHRATIMPAYTQFQAASPSSYGHYLLGVAGALVRHLQDVLDLVSSLDECPMGACGIAGTDLPINPDQVAELLGFVRPMPIAGDAIASRDRMLHLMSIQANAAITLSRLAADLQLWTTQEFELISLPDSLVGTSSLMPQKRNPYLLEHIKSDAAHCTSAWIDAAMCIVKVPFTNSVEAGNESTVGLWSSLKALTRSIELSALLVAAAQPNAQRMRELTANSWIGSTAIVNALVRADVPLRTAHELVGGAVRKATASGASPSAEAILAELPGDVTAKIRELNIDFDPEAIIERSNFGGGPGPASFDRGLLESRYAVTELQTEIDEIQLAEAASADRLSVAANSLRDI